MNEEQVDKLVWKIHTKADAKRILLAVAAEARKEGIEEAKTPAQEAVKTWLKTSQIKAKPSDALLYLDLMVEIAQALERLKEQP